MGGVSAVVGTLFDIALIAFFVTLVRIIITLSILHLPRHYLRNFLFCGSILGTVSLILMTFSFINNIFPGSISEIHLSDGKRQIVFLQMSHIGTYAYYKQVNKTLQDFTASGYIVYRE